MHHNTMFILKHETYTRPVWRSRVSSLPLCHHKFFNWFFSPFFVIETCDTWGIQSHLMVLSILSFVFFSFHSMKMVDIDNLKRFRTKFSIRLKPQWTSYPSFIHGKGHMMEYWCLHSKLRTTTFIMKCSIPQWITSGLECNKKLLILTKG
jgi:hypothetical protein